MITVLNNTPEIQQLLHAINVCSNQCVLKCTKDTKKISTTVPAENNNFFFYASFEVERDTPFEEDFFLYVDGINQLKTGLELLRFPSVIEIYKNYLICKEQITDQNNDGTFFKFGLAEPHSFPGQLGQVINIKKILKEMKYPYSFMLKKEQRVLIEKLVSVVESQGFTLPRLYFNFWPETKKLSVTIGDRNKELGHRAETVIQPGEEKGEKIEFPPLLPSLLKYLGLIRSSDLILNVNEMKSLMLANPIFNNSSSKETQKKIDYLYFLTFIKDM